MLEKLIIEKCATTLANLKTGEIVNFKFKDENEAKKEVKLLNNSLTTKGVNIEILVERENSLLLYVYRRERLKFDLSSPLEKMFLTNQGYVSDNIDKTIQLLRARMNESKFKNRFPHEIGLFLSYPVQDVKGFIENEGKNCMHCGYWKVYEDVEKAVLTFTKFDKCKDVYKKMCRQGASINKLTVAC